MVFFANLAVFQVFFMKFKMVIYQGLQLENNFGDLNDILAISWQFLAVYLVFFCCSLVFFAISGDIQGNLLPDLSNLEVNYIESTIIYQAVLFPQNIQNANLGILPVYIFIYLCFTPLCLFQLRGS